ncbi:MAG: hypothetical protein JW772_01130 [Candidatus Diapherotrites archaeon]|nr:hypothetical protein [Candidatus Diapherotrites archaeon]
MKKIFFVLLAFLALLPLVSADILGPEIFLFPGLALFVLIANAGFNALVMFLVQKFSLDSFFKNFKIEKIIGIIFGVTALGLIADVIAFFSAMLFSFLFEAGVYVYSSALLLAVAFVSILILDFILFKFYFKFTTKQALNLSSALAFFTNPGWLAFLGLYAGTVIFTLIIAGFVFLFFFLVYFTKHSKTDEKTKNNLERNMTLLFAFALICTVVFLLASIRPPGPLPGATEQSIVDALCARFATEDSCNQGDPDGSNGDCSTGDCFWDASQEFCAGKSAEQRSQTCFPVH